MGREKKRLVGGFLLTRTVSAKNRLVVDFSLVSSLHVRGHSQLMASRFLVVIFLVLAICLSYLLPLLRWNKNNEFAWKPPLQWTLPLIFLMGIQYLSVGQSEKSLRPFCGLIPLLFVWLRQASSTFVRTEYINPWLQGLHSITSVFSFTTEKRKHGSGQTREYYYEIHIFTFHT